MIVVAAGNEGLEVGRPAPFTDYARSVVQGHYVYPASYIGIDNLVVVGAMQSDDQGASFSNWSDTNVDITAPGAGILSSIPREAPDENGLPYNKDYDRWSGTSMAAPHVAGAISLYSVYFQLFFPFFSPKPFFLQQNILLNLSLPPFSESLFQ